MTITRPCPAPAPAASASRPTGAAAGCALLAALFLSACGGGGGDAPSPPPPPPAPLEVPRSAATSIESWEAFAVGLAPSDSTRPLGLDLVGSVPTSETAEPARLP